MSSRRVRGNVRYMNFLLGENGKGHMRIVRRLWWLSLCISMSYPVLQEGCTQEVKKQTSFFHTSNLVGSPVTGNRIALDEKGRVYLQTQRTVWPNNKVIPGCWQGGYMVYSPEGEIFSEFWGDMNGSHYHDINVMNDRVYVPSTWSPNIFVFNLEGQVLARVGAANRTSVSGAPDNSFWAINSTENKVDHYDQFGNYIGFIPSQDPQRVRVSPKDGRVYIANAGGIEVYSPDGTKEGTIPGWPLYNCTADGNVVAGFTVYTPQGQKVRDIQLDDFNYHTQDLAVDAEGNVYIAVKDPFNELGFVSYDAQGKFRFARGADFERMEAALPSHVLEPGKVYEIPITFESGRNKGYLAPGQILPEDKRETSVFSAFIKAVHGETWTAVGLAKDDAGKFTLTLPKDLTSGVYTLRLTAAREAETIGAPDLQCDFLIAVPTADELGTITIFSDRNRSVWRCGEEVPFCVVVRSSSNMAKTALQVEVVSVQPIKTVVMDLASGSTTIAFSIPAELTSALFPGDYTVLCREADTTMGNFAESAWNFQLSPSLRPTKFKMTHYPEVIEDDLPAQTVVSTVDVIARRGFNHDVRPVYSVASRREEMNLSAALSPEAKELEAILSQNPRLPAPDILYQRHRFEQYLEVTTENNIDSRIQLLFNEMMVPYLPEMWSNEQRQIQIFTQFASRYPSFAGWSFTGHAHIESFAESDNSAKALAKTKEEFIKQYGAPPEQKHQEWFKYYNHFIPDTYEAWDKAAMEVDPTLVNTASPGEFSSSASGKYPPWIYAPFKIQTAHIQEEQWHEQSIYPFMTDLIRLSDKPIISLHSQWHELGNGQYIGREYFLALSRCLQGLGISQSGLGSPYVSVLPHAPYNSLHKIFTVFGDLFFDLKPDNDIAILMSYSQEMTEGIKPIAWSEQMGRVFQLYTTALYAHLPVSIIYEEDLAALINEKTAHIKPNVVLITGLKTALPATVLEGIKVLQAKGGFVFADADTSSAIEGVQRLPLDFNDLWSLLSKSHTYSNSDSWRVRIDRVCADKAPVLRTILERVIPMEIDVDNPRCVIGLQKYGDTRYLVVANAEMVPIKPETLWHFTSYESTTFPAKPTITLSGALRKYEIYDLLSGRKVETTNKDNAVAFQADLTQCPGRVYVLLPEPITGVALFAPRNIEIGNALPVEVRVTDAGMKPFPGLVPVEIELSDQTGRTIETIYRVVPPEGLRCELKTALNWPAGRLQIRVRELITGRGTQATVTGSAQTLEEVVRLMPEIEVYDISAIHKLITSGKRFAILREDEHTELTPAVEAVKTTLTALRKDVVVLDAKIFQAERNTFDGVVVPWTPASRSPYFNQLEQLNSMQRRLSRNWPGRGRGTLEIVYAPRKYGENILILAGGDSDGLSKAADRLSLMNREHTETSKSAPQVPLELVEGETLSLRTLPDWDSDLFGPMVIGAAVSPDGRYLALASQSWGNNLFLLDKNGKILSAVRGGKNFPIPAHHNRLNQYLTVLDTGDLYARIADIQPPFIFLGNYQSDKIVQLYSMMGLRHTGPGDSARMTRTNDCSFAVAPNGTVVAAGNYGVVAFARNGRELWREDYWSNYHSLDSLIAKMTAEVAISQDGKFVALIKQRELESGNPEWKPSMVASLRELSTGKEIWSYTFLKGGLSSAKILSTDGNRLIIQSDETLVCLDSGKVIWTYDAPIITSNYYPTAVIYHPYMKTVCHNSRYALMGGKEGSVIFVDNGKVKWSDILPDGIFDIAINKDASRMATSSADGFLVYYDVLGKRLWTTQLPTHTALVFMGELLIAADGRGMVRYLDALGKIITTVDLARYTERSNMAQEFSVPETARVVNARMPKWQEAPVPAGKPNLAIGASIEVKAPAEWYSSGTMENSASVLNNGKIDDVQQTWLSLNECYWDASWQRLPQVTINFGQPQVVQAVVVKEHSQYPEAIPQEIAIEALGQDGTWKTVRVDLNVSGIVHTHTFAPVKTTALRYTVVADLFNNLWMTEVEVY